MEKKTEEINKKTELINRKLEEIKSEFDGLSDKQKTILAYRKIIELKEHDKKSVETLNLQKKDILEEQLTDNDLISVIVQASNKSIGFLKSLLLYVVCDNDTEYKKLYSVSLESYKKILKNYKQLTKEFNIDKSIDISHLFSYLLWNGYFSVNKQHSYKLQERLLLPGMYSFDIMKGKGVCLAYAQLLSDFLSTCDKNSALLNVKVPDKKNTISCNYRPEIERNVQSNKSSIIKSKIMTLLLKN